MYYPYYGWPSWSLPITYYVEPQPRRENSEYYEQPIYSGEPQTYSPRAETRPAPIQLNPNFSGDNLTASTSRRYNGSAVHRSISHEAPRVELPFFHHTPRSRINCTFENDGQAREVERRSRRSSFDEEVDEEVDEELHHVRMELLDVYIRGSKAKLNGAVQSWELDSRIDIIREEIANEPQLTPVMYHYEALYFPAESRPPL
ncbi:hypothetical protein BDV96DRAFT_649880 [Lophiotrema nucula]|uniref:Uncharacterized protein n=1 Tax=Lophiotrema nucula TaxID=690887 RepID=A0A6A5YXQ0_9PLEO|nr:hypothetical protein BDV96DRAFT_649880 [Lophiotrema nucula]